MDYPNYKPSDPYVKITFRVKRTFAEALTEFVDESKAVHDRIAGRTPSKAVVLVHSALRTFPRLREIAIVKHDVEAASRERRDA